MKFYQKTTFREYGIGDCSVYFAVADTYAELFQAGGKSVSYIELGSLKKDLSLDGKFAVDEISFELDSCAIQNQDEQDLLNLLLELGTNSIYCSVHFLQAESDKPDYDNCIFIGQISKDYESTDYLWKGAVYNLIPSDKKEYKFKAQTLDISMLDEVLLTEEIKSKSGQTVSLGIAKTAAFLVYLKNVGSYTHPCYIKFFNNHLNFPIPIPDCPNLNKNRLLYYLRGAVPLSDYLDAVMYACDRVVKELHNIDIHFNIVPGYLGLDVSPAQYELTNDNPTNEYRLDIFNRTYCDTDLRYKLWLGLTPDEQKDPSEKRKEPYINIRMFDPEYGSAEGNGYWTENISVCESLSEKKLHDWDIHKKSKEEWDMDRRRTVDAESKYSFLKFKNVSELLINIAEEFNCSLVSKLSYYENKLWCDISFVPKGDGNAPEQVKVKDITDAKMKRDVDILRSRKYYYAPLNASNNELATGLYDKWNMNNIFQMEDIDLEEKYQPNVKAEAEELGLGSNIELKPTLFATSMAEYNCTRNGKPYSRPLNTSLFGDVNVYNDNEKKDLLHVQDQPSNFAFHLSTQLYIQVPLPEEQQHRLNTEYGEPLIKGMVMRPILRYFTNVRGEPVKDAKGEGTRLSNIRNIVEGNDRKISTEEYEITVPYWNGFKSDTNDSESWKNLKLGSVIKIANEDYTIHSIEYNFNNPETKLKLRNRK